MYEMINRSGLSAHFAVIFIPLVFASIHGIVGGKQLGKHFAVLAVSYMLLILSNIPVLVMTSIIVALYLIVLLWQTRKGVTKIIFSLCTGAGLAAFYLV